MESNALHQRCGLVNTSQLKGKRLLFIGHPDPRKNVWEPASQLGVECNLIGPVPKKSIKGKDKVAKYISYDLTNHADDQRHSDVITQLVTSELGNIDGCLTIWDDCIPLTALVCTRLQKVGIPHWGAMAAKQKGLTFQALRIHTFSGVETVSNSNYSVSDALNCSDTCKDGILAKGEETARGGAPKENLLSKSNTCGKEISLAKYTSRCLSVATLEDVEKGTLTVGFPAVMKMECGAGALGIKVVENLEESRDHFKYLQQLCADTVDEVIRMTMGMGFKTHCVLMEFLKGSEHCVDLVAFHGELLLAVVTDKGPQCLPDTFHTVTIMPSLLSPNRQNDVITAAWDCCQALGLRHGVFDVDIMLTSSGPKLIEINARMGGYCQRDFARHCFGIDIFHLACMVACDVKPQFSEGFFLPKNKAVSIGDPKHPSFTTEKSKASCDGAHSSQAIIDSSDCHGMPSTKYIDDATLKTNINTDENQCNGSVTKGFAVSNGSILNEDSPGVCDSNTNVTDDKTSSVEKQRITAPVFPMPTSNCFVVGLTLYSHKHGAAFKTTTSRVTLQHLYEEGELLFPFFEVAPEDKNDEFPFYNLAVKGRSFLEARCKLEQLCEDLGVQAPELSSEHYMQL